ncbi:MAG: HAD-IB family phosphatase, partial [Planctomycetota bacterium]
MAHPARVDDSAPPYGTLVFDCDSTLSAIEGIDELAGERKPEIATLTERAMAGEVPLEAVYGRRLELLRPTRAQVAALGTQYVAHALPHARELIRALQALGKRVCILSGGLRQAIFALSDELRIDSGDVFAVDIFHGRDGSYAGFDEDSPLTRAGGKL